MPAPTVTSSVLQDNGFYLVTLSDGATFYAAREQFTVISDPTDPAKLLSVNADGSLTVIQKGANPAAIITHRSAIAAADGATKPAANNAGWAVNPGGKTKARVFVSTTGSPTACTIRPYLRSGGSTGQVGTAAVQTLAGTPNYDLCFDVQADGDDLFVYIETLTGGTSPTVTIAVSWR